MHSLRRKGDSSVNTEQNTEFKICKTGDKAAYKQELELNEKLLRSLQERRYFQSTCGFSASQSKREKTINHAPDT